jgi:alkanesulfonate monooxygenase SsuD/methylene tetrahydromethanopterin reductase-like flavin-dependent oxidoreductase (luciferase family)
MRLYRDNFRPSPSHAKPYAILGTPVICADTDEEAERLAKTVDLNIVRRAKGEYLPLASPEDAASYDYTPVDRARMAQNRARMSVGAPATVKARLMPLLAATQADELMATTMIFSHAARKRSYELLAEAFPPTVA